jgi:hypothetical protein
VFKAYQDRLVPQDPLDLKDLPDPLVLLDRKEPLDPLAPPDPRD